MSCIKAISISRKRGEKKQNIPNAVLKTDHGIIDDAHAGYGHRQVSLMSFEAIERTREQGLEVNPGDFAENICTQGLPLNRVRIGSKIHIGNEVILEVTQIGKECHHPCRIYHTLGHCAMPEEGIFTTVLKGGGIKVSDPVHISDNS